MRITLETVPRLGCFASLYGQTPLCGSPSTITMSRTHTRMSYTVNVRTPLAELHQKRQNPPTPRHALSVRSRPPVTRPRHVPSPPAPCRLARRSSVPTAPERLPLSRPPSRQPTPDSREPDRAACFDGAECSPKMPP